MGYCSETPSGMGSIRGRRRMGRLARSARRTSRAAPSSAIQTYPSAGHIRTARPVPRILKPWDTSLFTLFKTTYMRRVVRAGRCRCGNRVGSIEERPVQSCAGLALNKLEDKLETPSGANISIGMGHQPMRWIAIGGNKKVITKTLRIT